MALYELIKNGVDAQQDLDFEERRIIISAHIWLLRSEYLRLIRRLKEGDSTENILTDLRNRVSDGADSNRVSETFSVLEQSSGSAVEFSQALQNAYETENWIEVSDAGRGMSLDDLERIFLHIGTRSRRAENLGGAMYLGDKGVGRLSAMRLGDRLYVQTTKKGETVYNVLDIDWSRFAHDNDLRADEVPIEPTLGDPKPDAKQSGTTVRVCNLNADWDSVRFRQMLQGRIARMVDPFQKGRANKLIDARFNGRVISVPSIPSELLKAAHATLKAEFRFEDGVPVLDGIIDYSQKHRQRIIDVRGAEIFSLTQETKKRRGKKGHAASVLVPLEPIALEKLGPFTCEIYWYNRRVVTGVQGLSATMAETRQRIAEWAGGPMLYRYGFRVLPYGDPDDDWLALDEAAFGESGFKLNRQQVIGRVSVNSPHTSMSEQTNREGLIESDAANALKRIMQWLLHVQMRGLIKEVDRVEEFAKRTAQEDAVNLRSRRIQVESILEELRLETGAQHEKVIARLSREVAELTAQASGLVSRLDSVVEEAEDEREKFVYLAGVGLMTEFIFHEMDRAVSHTLSSIARSRDGQLEAVLESLADQLKTLQKRISAFDEMTSEKRQTKTDFDLRELVSNVLQSHSEEFRRHSVVVYCGLPDVPMPIKAVRGMVIQILENVVTNALYWLKRQAAYEVNLVPRIWITLDAAGKTLTIEDNGPGVIPDRMERIFQAFETTKPAGQGRGLGLYISRELAGYHKWKLAMDPTLGRQRSGRTNAFILDMG
ncbi:HAMP domain-containing histidine kinase [Aurantimonas litoralis]|nr:HAMP domain-containing histidine kinase [Aurantimonas litoralis]